MNPKEYVENVLKTESIDFYAITTRMSENFAIRLDHASDGLCTEAGEFKDVLKKFKFYGRDIDRVNLIEELGDLMWYVGIACDVLDISLEEVMEKNIAKLKARYGEKFSEERAEHRDLENERSILTKSATDVHFSLAGITTVCGRSVKKVGYYTRHLAAVTCEQCKKGARVNYGNREFDPD